MKTKNNKNKTSFIAKLMASTLLAALVLTAIQPTMTAYAETETSVEQNAAETGDVTKEDAGAGTTGESETEKARRQSPEPETETPGSVIVQFEAKDEATHPIKDGKVELYRVAEIVRVIKDIDYRYRYIDDFAGFNKEDGYSGLESDEDLSLELAKELADVIESKIKDGEKLKAEFKVKDIDKDSKASFDSLKTGLYLVMQRDGEESEGYAPIDPFLVSIPQYNTTDGKAKYEIEAAPKTDPKDIEHDLEFCKADPPVQKIVTGTGAQAGDIFKFVFMGGTKENPVKEYPLPNGNSTKKDEYSVELSVTTKNINGAIMSPDDDSAEFGEIEFKKAGTYIYTLYEDSADKLENYSYDTASYKITFDVKIDDKKESLYVASITSEKSNDTKQVQIQYSNNKFARPAATQFSFTNTYTKPGPPEKDTTRPRKQSETTPRDRVTPTPSAPAESPTVAGATRTPEPEGDVLGAARTPQAVLGASRLPQTGQLWWPVPVLMVAGIALMAGGLVKRRYDE